MTCSISTSPRLFLACCLATTVAACGSGESEPSNSNGASSSDGPGASGGAMEGSGGDSPNGGDPGEGAATGDSGGANSTGGTESNTGGSNAGGSLNGGGNNMPTGGASSAGGGPAAGGMPGSGGTTGTGGAFTGTSSAGCGGPPGLESGSNTLDVDGEERSFILTRPEGMDDEALPLIFGFHGLMYDAEWVANGEAPLSGPYFGMLEEAGDAAVFVAPQALSGGWNEGDLPFVEAMVEEMTQSLCIDEDRIFATGFSMGGILTATIGCALTDTFRAVAPQSANLPASCSDSLPALPYLGNHGEQDNVITLEQGQALRDSYLARNGCATSAPSADEWGCVHYEECQVGKPVSFCTYPGEHVPNPDAGPILWRFFSSL